MDELFDLLSEEAGFSVEEHLGSTLGSIGIDSLALVVAVVRLEGVVGRPWLALDTVDISLISIADLGQMCELYVRPERD